MPPAITRFAVVLAFAAAPAFAAGNKEEGHIKVYTCTGCHGIPAYKNAYPTYSVPKIHGQNEAYIVAALNGYRNGDRPHPTMRAHAESLTDQDIADIAAYLSDLGTKATGGQP